MQTQNSDINARESVPFLNDDLMGLSKPCVSSGLGKALETKRLAF